MFDNLRESAEMPFYEEEPNELYREPASRPITPSRRSNRRFLGMTAPQRFIISLMLFFTVCILGTLVMFVLGKMSLF
ncbi:MAG TPA: hypothetical protein VNK49_06050 [Anaerolineales bacterium]|nr:hypothetical protein [Anaerolineales bacterium]